MKNFKTLMFAALMVCSVAVMAQDRPQGQRQGGQQGGRQQWTVKDRAEREAAQIHGAVSLSDAQIAQVYQVTYKYALQDSIRMVEMRAQREQGQQMDREKMMQQRTEITKAKTAEINAVLNPDQQKKYAKMVEEQNANRQGRQGGQGGPQGGQGGRQGGQQGGGF